MKKLLLVLGMLTCFFGLTACGSSNTEISDEIPLVTEAEAVEWAETQVNQINEIINSGMASYYADDKVAAAGLESWSKAMEEMGEYQGIEGYKTDITSEQATIVVEISGTNKNGEVTFIIDETGMLTSMDTQVKKTMADLMKGAALNTIICMTTVFIVLVLIMWIISCFKIINKLQNKPKRENETEKSVDNTIAQIVEKEELSDDLELVAVIAAAIAASEGATSTEGFVVRSIKRSGSNKWQKA